VSLMIIPPQLRERQKTASDPERSIWVSANAGSGKTHVLTQRVIRLLLGGTAPSKILCLTFTKAAAAQMATRVFDTLSRWTDMSDADLRAAIVETGAPTPTAPDLVLARRLFTRTIETPGGLKIQTIHAFCERLLHLFPFEANVPARFEVADDLRAQEMLSLAKRAAIAEAQRSEQAEALALVADLAGTAGIDALLGTAMRMRAGARGRRDLQDQLAPRLGVDGAVNVETVRHAMIENGIAPIRWPEIALVFDAGSANDKKHARRFRDAATAWAKHDDPTRVTQTVSAYLTIFFDAKAEPRPSLMTQKLAKAHPAVNADLLAERDRMVALRDTLRIAEAIERTRALLALVEATTRRYNAVKIAGGLLDFDDLIERTLALLDRSDSGWVLHKLDAGIDHVLVDEAQDTSETQWRILDALTNDFSSGLGGRSQRRSFFVVGDDKQSIFSFQGAAPLMFDTMRSQFERRFKAGQKPFERVSLKTSFRSVPGILAAVDAVFSLDAHQDGLVRKPDIWPSHESIKLRLPSLVEIWPPLGATKTPDPQDWSIPLDTPSELDPANVVADRVARKIKQLIAPDSGEHVHDGRGETKRPIGPGDILILVRTRGEFFEAVIRALKRHYVPVAGADRLDVANHIAVMDLAAAGRAALLPRDDLSVACVLKSPLFGLTDADLIAVAPRREGSLIDALAQSPDPRHREAHAAILRAGHPLDAVRLLRRTARSRRGPQAHGGSARSRGA
jgi:ATP-dependent helicase/nuclease subunit A